MWSSYKDTGLTDPRPISNLALLDRVPLAASANALLEETLAVLNDEALIRAVQETVGERALGEGACGHSPLAGERDACPALMSLLTSHAFFIE